MIDRELEHDYFEWMYETVYHDNTDEEASFRKLLTRLHEIEFIYFVPKDDNRASDGIRLRYLYGYSNNIPNAEDYIEGPCSVFEMILALAIRIEETMENTKYGDRTRFWFWRMIITMGLGGMTDRNFDLVFVNDTVDRFLRRDYKPDGRGGLFKIRSDQYDMRKLEIWTQVARYLEEWSD